MKDELISSVAIILEEWNPLGDKAASVKDLEGYKYEAMDILSAICIIKISTKESVAQVLEQAFSISLEEHELNRYSAKIDQLINVQ